MTTMIEPDTRGVDALSGRLDDNLLPPRLFEQLRAEMGQQFAEAPWPQQLPEFDDEPWRQLPTITDVEALWLESAPIDRLIAELGHRAHGDGADLPQFMAWQWYMAGMELDLKRAREAQDDTGADDDCAAEEAAGLASAETGGGGGDLPGGSEDGDQVVAGGKVAGGADSGKASKVPRKRGPRAAR